MSVTSTVEMGKEGLVGSTLLKVYGAYGAVMEVLYTCDSNQVMELTVGSVLGPWYVARNIPMASGLQDTDQRILAAARHFRLVAGEQSLMLKTGPELWNLFRTIWDYLEIDAPLA